MTPNGGAASEILQQSALYNRAQESIPSPWLPARARLPGTLSDIVCCFLTPDSYWYDEISPA
jgi:hypothetical protein